MPGLPPAGPPRLDLPASLGGSLPPPRGSDPLMSLGPSAPSSGPQAPGLRAPSVNDKVIYNLWAVYFILFHFTFIYFLSKELIYFEFLKKNLRNDCHLF